MKRVVSEQELCHDRLGESFGAHVSRYDTSRRVEVLVEEFLQDYSLEGLRILDVGCGLGFFSERLAAFGADVVAVDIGPRLVAATRERAGCDATVGDALRLTEQFGEGVFDGVVSSECIEHTPAPDEALREMVRVVKPGGFLAISTPNVLWWPLVKAATVLHVRPYDGYENFSSWRRLRSTLSNSGAEVVREVGLHLFPFQLPMHGLSRWCDRHLQVLRGLMINLCVLAIRLR